MARIHTEYQSKLLVSIIWHLGVLGNNENRGAPDHRENITSASIEKEHNGSGSSNVDDVDNDADNDTEDDDDDIPIPNVQVVLDQIQDTESI